jgi:MFS family permease
MSAGAISRSIWVLSLVSLFTDMASDMLYPVMPAYLRSIGFSVAFIRLLEGIAEAAAGLSKDYFGYWSDMSGKRHIARNNPSGVRVEAAFKPDTDSYP